VLDLEAYAADCRLYGHVDAADQRLTDLLNATPELRVVDARLEALADGHVVELAELTIGRDELCAVVASGSRGDAARRVRTHATRVQVDLGPYLVEGDVHGTPASDPLYVALRRAAWVPLTDVSVTYRRGAESVTDEVATLLVNRELAASFKAVEDVPVVYPWEAARGPGHATPPTPRAIDLTGTLQDDIPARSDEPARLPTTDPPL
jgi:hypothetical protein